MMDVFDFQRGRELLFDRQSRFLMDDVNGRETPSESKFPGGSDYKLPSWDFHEGESKGFIGKSRSTAEAHEHVTLSESTEEDEDYIAELTRQMTHYMLQDDDKHDHSSDICNSEKNEELWDGVGWPSDSSSTLWSPLGSSSGSPEGPSDQEPSPPVTPGNDQACERKIPSYAEVLCKLDKLGMSKQGKPSDTTIPAVANENTKQGVAYDESQDTKTHVKEKDGQNPNKQRSMNRARQAKNIGYRKCESYNVSQRKVGSCANGSLRPLPLHPIANLPSNPWQGHPGMRAVFLSRAGSNMSTITASSGTGVFLPCVIGDTSQSPKNKRGCAPVLIPAKVVQALKVHFDRVGDHLPRPNPTTATAHHPTQTDPCVKGGRRTSTSSNKKRQSARAAAPPDMNNNNNNNNEMGLPQEWTY